MKAKTVEGLIADSVEGRVMDVLRQRKAHACSEGELKDISGIRGTSFKEAMIRLRYKELVVQWKTELLVNYIVAKQWSNEAYYEEKVVLPELYTSFGYPSREITVQRSIPFIRLHDNEVHKPYRNRYRSMAPALPAKA